jgi:amidase
MRIDEYCEFDALGLVEQVRNGEVTPRELCELALEGVAKVNPRLNCVVDTYPDVLERLDREPPPAGPLSGVPFFLKDIGPMEKGRPYEMGSRLLEGYVGPIDTDLMLRFRAAGLLNLGRTPCPEQGYTITTESLLYGTTHNPWNPEHIAGGSSSGAGASVAAGVVPISHANDGGGSTRIPASVNGLVGLKTSRGRVPQGPFLNDISGFLFSDLVVSRSVRDTAAVLDAVQGPGIGEAFEIAPPAEPYSEAVARPPVSLRIGFCSNAWGPVTPTPDVTRGVDEAARACESLGHELTPVTAPFDFEAFFQSFMTIWYGGIPADLDAMAHEVGRKIDSSTVEPIVLAAYERGHRISAPQWMQALGNLNELTRTFGALFQDFDLLLTPTLATPPPRLGRHHLHRTDVEPDAFFRELFHIIPYTPIANGTGLPAISLPLAMSDDGLPVGIHFMAPFGREDRLLGLAAALEQELPWRNRRPGIHVAT